MAGAEVDATPAVREEVVGGEGTKSALEENIEKKGKHAYYFAHAHKANGPKWDGKIEPKLLSSKSGVEEKSKTSAFEYHRSNITSYAFADEGKKVKIYISLEGVGEKCKEEDITIDSSEQSFCLVVNNYEDRERCLSFGKLSGKISEAKFKLKMDKIIVILTKQGEADPELEPKEWHTLADKGIPDHELV